jgi:hypothetical protein|tara:strand:+ start:547 stop:657 length:111 start_codon:yes stop_codon:yes gene_type:complete
MISEEFWIKEVTTKQKRWREKRVLLYLREEATMMNS